MVLSLLARRSRKLNQDLVGSWKILAAHSSECHLSSKHHQRSGLYSTSVEHAGRAPQFTEQVQDHANSTQHWPLLIDRKEFRHSTLQEAEPKLNPKRQRKSYQIKVETGDVRGAGSKAPAVLQLYGERGSSTMLTIGTAEEDQGFERGSIQEYTLEAEGDLGTIKRCYVRQEIQGDSETAHGWFLHQVTVTDNNGEIWAFPCNSWIGDSDADGYAAGRERNLILCELPELNTQDQRVLSQPLRVTFGAISIPHPEKVSKDKAKAVNKQSEGWGGEDAYFCAAGRYGIVGMGVADGVYAWKERGIDAGAFSRSLMSRARREIMSGNDDVVRLMEATVEQTYADEVEGSSTACLVLIDTLHGRLTSANIGDSGFLVLGSTRKDQHEMEVKHHSPQQEHQFGFPYQLGHHDGADPVESAMLHTQPVSSGDVIVLGSDGLWDNVSVHEISELVKSKFATGCRPSIVAQSLAKLAFDHAVDKNAVTPYSVGASEAFDMVYSGGKQDDITVIVSQLS